MSVVRKGYLTAIVAFLIFMIPEMIAGLIFLGYLWSQWIGV